MSSWLTGCLGCALFVTRNSWWFGVIEFKSLILYKTVEFVQKWIARFVSRRKVLWPKPDPNGCSSVPKYWVSEPRISYLQDSFITDHCPQSWLNLRFSPCPLGGVFNHKRPGICWNRFTLFSWRIIVPLRWCPFEIVFVLTFEKELRFQFLCTAAAIAHSIIRSLLVCTRCQ